MNGFDSLRLLDVALGNAEGEVEEFVVVFLGERFGNDEISAPIDEAGHRLQDPVAQAFGIQRAFQKLEKFHCVATVGLMAF